MAKNISVVGDTSDHGGQIVTSAQDGTLLLKIGGSTSSGGGEGGQYGTITYGSPSEEGGSSAGMVVAVNGCEFDCPIHGRVTVTAITTKTFQNNKLIITDGANLSCGGHVISPFRGVTVE